MGVLGFLCTSRKCVHKTTPTASGLRLKVAGDPVRTLLAEAVPGSVPAEIGNDQPIVFIDVLNQVVPDLSMVLVGHD